MTDRIRSGIFLPAAISALFFSLFTIYLAGIHDWRLSALMMLPQDGDCYERLGAPPGTAVFTREGYDGHLFYYMAQDLAMEAPCTNAYMYQRILYPLLIRLFSWGDPLLMPLAMVLINILAIGAGTFIMSLWLAGLGRSPWLGLFYGLCLGHVIIVQYALAGALAATLALSGAYALVRSRRPAWAALWFTLALLTRETPIMLLGPLLLWTLYKRDWPAVIGLVLAVAVYLGWQLFLLQRFHTFELTGTNADAITPDLAGLRLFLSNIDFSHGLRQFLRTSSSLPYLVFVLTAGVLSLRAYVRGRSLWAGVTTLQAWGSLFLGTGMWIYISSVGRITITLVPAVILFAVESRTRIRTVLLALLGGLFLVGLLRVHLAGVHDFFVVR